MNKNNCKAIEFHEYDSSDLKNNNSNADILSSHQTSFIELKTKNKTNISLTRFK